MQVNLSVLWYPLLSVLILHLVGVELLIQNIMKHKVQLILSVRIVDIT
jgi:hypothetical protein